MTNAQTLKLSNGKTMEIVKLGKAAGRKHFKAEGFTQCRNPHYMERDGTIVNFNSIMKVWIVNS